MLVYNTDVKCSMGLNMPFFFIRVILAVGVLFTVAIEKFPPGEKNWRRKGKFHRACNPDKKLQNEMLAKAIIAV
jgi:hypothetical protein